MSQVFLASRNERKLVEMRRILDPFVPEIEVLGLDDVAEYDEPAETEPTFEGNALIKAHAGVLATGLPSLADDSGLCVDALNGMPGVLSARWSGVARSGAAVVDRVAVDRGAVDRGVVDRVAVERADVDRAAVDRAAVDRANNELLLAQLSEVPEERRGAQFRCAVAFAYPVGAGGVAEQVARGVMPGRVLREMRGSGGFGYDVVFVADGHEQTSAELAAAEKDAISHRGRAIREIAPTVADVLDGL